MQIRNDNATLAKHTHSTPMFHTTSKTHNIPQTIARIGGTQAPRAEADLISYNRTQSVQLCGAIWLGVPQSFWTPGKGTGPTHA